MRQINLRLPEDLLGLVDVARGGVPRERWIRDVLTVAVSEPSTVVVGRVGGVGPVVGAPVVRTALVASRGHLASCRCPVCRPAKES